MLFGLYNITNKKSIYRVKLCKQVIDKKIILRDDEMILFVLFMNKWDFVKQDVNNKTVTELELDDLRSNNHRIGWFNVMSQCPLNQLVSKTN